MKRLILTIAAAALLALGLASSAQAEFGLKDLDVTFNNEDGSVALQAGSHPYSLTTTIGFNTTTSEQFSYEVPDGEPKNIRVPQMEGLVGNPSVVPPCSNADFLKRQCPATSQVGVNRVSWGEPTNFETVQVYSLNPPPGVAMKLGFQVLVVPITIELGVNESFPSNVVASLTNISNVVPLYSSELTLWGVPAAKAHDAERHGPGCSGGCSTNLTLEPFLTAPRACNGPLSTTFEAESWPPAGSSLGTRFEESILTHDDAQPPNPQGMIGCGQLSFSPSISAQPTSKAASSPTGLDFSLNVNDEGLGSPDGLAQSDIRKAVVTLPEGFTANPSLAEGLNTCSEDDLARERYNSEAGAGCPNASKVGTVEVETPLLENKSVNGSLFVATPYENPFDSLLALYLVVKNEELGIKIAQPLKVEPDPVTGQLTTVADNIPQLPFSHFRLHFREGTRSPLATPPSCGSHTVKAVLYPWAGGPPITSTSTFQVITGPNAGPCPAGGTPPFKPSLIAGSINNAAGRYSPFNVRISRTDAEQEITHFSIKLPPGITGRLAGIPFCPDGAIAAAKAREGQPHGGAEEIAQPSCPLASAVGRTLVGSGVGPALTYVPGKVYLAGPYNGSPLSIVAITAAKAGPFDLGTVVVREALRINPETAEVFVDATDSDPIPHIIRGIPVHLRDVRAYVDRTDFVLNPTSCTPTSTASTVLGSGSDFASPADDVPVTVSTRYQAADCGTLAYKPRLQLKLKGSVKRGGNPALTAIFTPRPGDANTETLSVALPRSEFLEQGHLGTSCTRVQFKAGAGNGAECPAASVYGRARAWTPLLDEPLEGPIFLRSNGGERELPDLVLALDGLIEFNAVGFIDSVNGGIRNTFQTVPDAPVSKVLVELGGGKKSLLANSTNICRGVHKATVKFGAHNGKRTQVKVPLKAQCKKKKPTRRARAGGR